MSDEMILQAVAQYKKEFDQAQKIFNKEGKALEQRGRCTVFGMDEVNTALDMVHEGARITASFFASCDVIVLSLDSTCRPMLANSPGLQAVKSVVELIAEINSAIANTRTDFSVSLNGSSSRDVGSIRPIASVEALKIEKYWDGYYHRMPEYASEQKKAARAEQRQRNKAINQEQINSELRAQAAALTQQHLQKVDTFRKNLDARIQDVTALRKEELIAEKQSLQSKLIETQHELNNLGFFKFREKKTLREKIATIQSQIDKYSNPQYGLDVIQTKRDKAAAALANYEAEVKEFCSCFVQTRMEYTTVPRTAPRKPISSCTRIEQSILNAMIKGYRYTASDIVTLLYSQEIPSIGKLMPHLKSLLADQLLDEELSHGRRMYSIAGPEKKIATEIVTLNQELMECPCPQAPDVESILG